MSLHLYSEKLFVKFMNSWAEEYREKTIAENYKFLTAIAGTEIPPPMKPADKKFFGKMLDGQILFMKYYTTTRMMLSTTKQNFIDVKRFLERQKPWDIKGALPEYVVHFNLMNKSVVFLLTNNLDEFDYADIYAGTCFDWIYIDKLSWETVPKRFPPKFEKLLRKDLEYDYEGVELTVPYVYHLGIGHPPFQIKVEIQGDLGFDKVVKAKKCNDLFKVDIINWVLGKTKK